MNEGQEVPGGLLVARRHPAAVLDFIPKTPGPAVAPTAAPVRRLWPVGIALGAALAGGVAWFLARSQHWF